jgi:hypothetical protein
VDFGEGENDQSKTDEASHTDFEEGSPQDGDGLVQYNDDYQSAENDVVYSGPEEFLYQPSQIFSVPTKMTTDQETQPEVNYIESQRVEYPESPESEPQVADQEQPDSDDYQTAPVDYTREDQGLPSLDYNVQVQALEGDLVRVQLNDMEFYTLSGTNDTHNNGQSLESDLEIKKFLARIHTIHIPTGTSMEKTISPPEDVQEAYFQTQSHSKNDDTLRLTLTHPEGDQNILMCDTYRIDSSTSAPPNPVLFNNTSAFQDDPIHNDLKISSEFRHSEFYELVQIQTQLLSDNIMPSKYTTTTEMSPDTAAFLLQTQSPSTQPAQPSRRHPADDDTFKGSEFYELIQIQKDLLRDNIELIKTERTLTENNLERFRR